VPGAGLDDSWMIALNLAVKNHLLYGKDFIFTYGPLGFLSTNLGAEIPYGMIWIWLFHLSIISLFLYIIRKIISDNNSFLVYGIILVSAYHFSYTDLTPRIMMLVFFLIIQNIKKLNMYTFAITGLLITLQFFIRPFAALYFFIIFSISVLYITFVKKQKWSLLYPFGIILLVFIISILLNVDLNWYIRTDYNLTETYSDTMNLINFANFSASFLIFSAIMFFILFLAVVLIKIVKSKNFDLTIYSIIALLFLYFSFKQGYVRFDTVHIMSFWGIILGITAIYVFFTAQYLNKVTIILYAVILIITVSTFSFLHSVIPYRYPFQLPTQYIKQLLPGAMANYMERTKKYAALPDSILQMIGDNPIDVIPVDIATLYLNGLNYMPRPVIQSYVTSSDYLNSINYEYYMGNNSPDYVLFSNNSIDTRHPFWDESMTKEALLCNYDIVDSVFLLKEQQDNAMLLKKKQKPLHLKKEITFDSRIKFNEYFSLPTSDSIIYLAAEFNYNFLGKLEKFLYQAPIVDIELFYTDGKTSRHRIVVPEMMHGVIINKTLLTQDDAFKLFKYRGYKNQNVKGFIFSCDNNAYLENINIRLTYHSFY
jgi:hypothetical protein